MKKTVFIFLLLFTFCAYAQENLVPNGSFEEYDSCPKPVDNLPCKYWFNPIYYISGGALTPDYFNPCTIYNEVNVPLNSWGTQEAQNGMSYVGLVLNSDAGYREYIAAKLTNQLINNGLYQFEYYVSLCDFYNYGSNNFEILFTVDTLELQNQTQIQLSGNPAFIIDENIINNEEVILDTLNWIKISGTYLAKGGENYIIIGNFKLQNETSFGINNGLDFYSYYYIDNVSLKLVKLFTHIPNVFTPNNDQVNDVFDIKGPELVSFTVLNRWGNLLCYSEKEAKWDGTVSGEQCDEGTYFYVYEYLGMNKVKERKVGFFQLIN